jgi:RNA polymerase sigma-70 factor (ECF subfamily)
MENLRSWAASGLASASTAEAELFLASHKERVLKVCLSIIGHRERAEDAAQEALIKAWINRTDVRDDEKEAAWVRVIAVRQAWTEVRRYPDTDELSESIPDKGSADETALVQAALNRIPAERRIVLILAESEGMTMDEIGEALDIPSGTAASRLYRARIAFQTYWEQGDK